MSDKTVILRASQAHGNRCRVFPTRNAAVRCLRQPPTSRDARPGYTAGLVSMELLDAQQPSEERKSRDEGKGCVGEGLVGPRENHRSRESGGSSASPRSQLSELAQKKRV